MINRVVLVGRLTKDVDLKYTGSGTAVASFTCAVNRQFKNPNGEREADFVNCVAWRKTAETLANFTRKGSLVGLEGRIQTRSYDNQQGQRIYVTEVVVDTFSMLESKERQNNVNTDNQAQSSTNTFNNNQNANNQSNFNGQGNLGADPVRDRQDPFSGQAVDISDDDLPF